jgi:predicted  nucleic acid-binding Zn-ribbon protein
MDRHQEKEVELGRRITALRRTLHELDEQRDQVRRDIDSVRKLIAQLREQQQDRTKAFGSMMPDVLRAIRKEERWHEMPIGPIGKLRSSLNFQA